MRRILFAILFTAFAASVHAAALGYDGNLVGYKPNRPKPPCYGDSCYIPCQQAYNAAGNVSAVSNACLQHCMLNNGGGGSSGGYPDTFMDACMSCAAMDITAAVQLGVYANCKVTQTLSLAGPIVDDLIDLTGCGEEPETCETSAGNAGSLQAVANAMSKSLGQPIEVLATPAAKAAYMEKLRKQAKPAGKK